MLKIFAYITSLPSPVEIKAVYQYNFAKMVKVSKLVQMKLIPYRSIIESGSFRRLNILEIFQNIYCVYGYLTIKSKFLKNIFLLSC